MMEIKIDKTTRMVNLAKAVIGNDAENLQETLVFKFTNDFVDGQARLEYMIDGTKYYIPLTKDGKSYTLPVKNVLTKEGKIQMQLVITEGTSEEDIPVFKSNVFYLYCNQSINAVDEAPSSYELWIEQANAKLNAMDEALTEVDNLDIDVSKSGNTATVEITQKNGTTKSIQILDGEKGETGSAGRDGADGITPIIGNNGNWFLGTTDTGKPSRGEVGATGQTGASGQDGISPTATITKSGNTATITITDKNGTTTATVSDGTNGTNGTNGRDGYVQYTAGENITIENNVISAGASINNMMPKLFDLAGNTYQAGTPTPDAPQDIEVVTGDNDIVICGKNLFDINTTIDGKYYESNGTLATVANSFGKILEIQPNTIYSLSIQNNYSSSFRRYIFVFDKDMNMLKSLGWGDVIASNTTFVRENYKTPENAKYITISQVDAPTANKNDIQIMFEKGLTVSNYEPYKEQVYPINLGVENLFNKDNVINKNWNAIIGTSTYTDGTTANKLANSIPIEVKENTNYTISWENNDINITAFNYYEYDKNGILIAYNTSPGWQNNSTITTNTDTKYINISSFGNNILTNLTKQKDTLQIEEGTKANSFSPYGQTPIELCKIGTYQDKFKYENGKWYLHKEVGKYQFTGNETWGDYANSVSDLYKSYSTDVRLGRTNSFETDGYCDYFITLPDYSAITTLVGYVITKNACYLSVSTTIANSASELKTWIGNNKPIIFYILATPTDTQITDTTLINQLNAVHYAVTYGADTNVSQNNYEQPFEITYETIDNLSEYINGIIGAYITTTLEGVY